MYNKLFTKILGSSIWLESTPTRIVWITFLAAMDEDGHCRFSAVGNVAHAARVTIAEAAEAIRIFEGPDPESGNPANEGRRIERVPGGWMVLNAKDHRDMVTRAAVQEQTRLRVQRHREKKRNGDTVTDPLPTVICNTSDTDTDTDTETNTETNTDKIKPTRSKNARARVVAPMFDGFWKAYPKKAGKGQAEKAWGNLKPDGALVGKIMAALEWQPNQPNWRKDGGRFIPYPATWLNARRWEDEPFHPVNARNAPNAEVFGRVFGGKAES